MSRISTNEFLAFVGTLGNQQISTRAGRAKFTVRLCDGGLELTPLSSMKPRRHTHRYVVRVLDQFQQTGGSLENEDYKFTVNAPYMLALIEQYLEKGHVA